MTAFSGAGGRVKFLGLPKESRRARASIFLTKIILFRVNQLQSEFCSAQRVS
jgi:hypothetical protein